MEGCIELRQVGRLPLVWMTGFGVGKKPRACEGIWWLGNATLLPSSLSRESINLAFISPSKPRECSIGSLPFSRYSKAGSIEL